MHTIGTLTLVSLGVLVLLVVGAVLLRLIGRGLRTDGTTVNYEAVTALLTPAERSFFGVLQQAVASDYQIFSKVRLADIVRPARSPSRSGWQSAFNRISAKHVDFVLCDTSNLRILGVIELDDQSHDRSERGVRDNLVNSALAGAGVPVLRIPAKHSYLPGQLREQVEQLLRSTREPQPPTLGKL